MQHVTGTPLKLLLRRRDEKLQLRQRSDLCGAMRTLTVLFPLSKCVLYLDGLDSSSSCFLSTSKTLKPLKAAFQVTQQPRKQNHVLAIPLYFDANFQPL